MNNNDTTTDLLIQYLDNELDDTAKASLESRIASDNELKDKLETIRLTRDAVHLYGLKQQVSQIAKGISGQGVTNIRPDVKRFRSTLKRALAVAAVLVLLIAGIGIYEYSTISSNKLYAELYQPYQVRSSRGGAIIDEVEAAFKAKDYARTISSFQSQNVHSTQDYFFAGQAYLEQNNPQQAIVYLEQARASSQSSHLLSDESEFYLALAYLKANQLSKAQPLFEKIHSDQNHLFHKQVSSWFMRKFHLLEQK